MNVHRKGWDDMMVLRLKMNEKTTDELLSVIAARDPEHTRRYLHSAKMRKAAMVVLRVRGVMAEPK